MVKASGKNNEHLVRLEKQIRQFQAATAPASKFFSDHGLVDKLLRESTASARAAAELMQQSEMLRTVSRRAEVFSGIQNSLVEKLNIAYPAGQLEHLTMVSEATRLSIVDSGMAARTAALLSQFDMRYLSETRLPQTHLISERISNLIQNLYIDIEAEHPFEAEEIKEAAETLDRAYSQSNTKSFTLVEAIAVLSFLMSFIATCYAIADHYGNKKFQAQLLNAQIEMLGQMYELNSKIVSAVSEEADTPSDMTEYVVVRAVNLRTEHHRGTGSHVITTLMPNQKVELLKQAEHPNKKWIYVGYRDNIEGIPRTGWVYKKYLKRLK